MAESVASLVDRLTALSARFRADAAILRKSALKRRDRGDDEDDLTDHAKILEDCADRIDAELREASSRLAEGTREDELGWLIEDAQGQYWDGRRADSFTSKHDEAVRFARFEDAERVRCWLVKSGEHFRSVQHAWVGASPRVSAATPAPKDDLGLSIDMLDVDRLRLWADRIASYGPNIHEWGSCSFVVQELRRIADGVEKAVRDIGVLRVSAAERPAQTWQPIESAPTDGRIVLIVDMDRKVPIPVSARFVKEVDAWLTIPGSQHVTAFTHWAEIAPLPAAPRSVVAPETKEK